MKYIVVHAGARDWYRLAISLYENDRLAYLVTDDIIFRKKYERKTFRSFYHGDVNLCY